MNAHKIKNVGHIGISKLSSIETQLEITNIGINKYDDHESGNILFSELSSLTENKYRPIVMNQIITTKPAQVNEECQINYVEFTSTKYVDATVEHIDEETSTYIEHNDIDIQTDPIISVTDTVIHKLVDVNDLETPPPKVTTDAKINHTQSIIISKSCENISHKNIYIENSYEVCNVSLIRSREIIDDFDIEMKDICLINPSGFHSFISTDKGTFYLDSGSSHKKIISSPMMSEWIIVDKYNNMFPTNISIDLHTDIQHTSFGSAVATNGYGNVCAISGITRDFGSSVKSHHSRISHGAVWIYAYVEHYWTICEELSVPDTVFFGTALSFDYRGHTLAIGGSGDCNFMGACWIYTNPNDHLTQHSTWNFTKKITCGDKNITGKLFFGINLQLTPNGKKLFVSGTGYNNYLGAVWVYDSCNWDETQCIKNPTTSKLFGSFISVNHDSSDVIIGSATNIMMFRYDEGTYSHHSSLFNDDIINIISICPKYNNIVTILRKTNLQDVYILKFKQLNATHKWIATHELFKECGIEFNELICCDSTDNNKTIIVVGIDTNNMCTQWCFIKINKKWMMNNKQILNDATNEISINMSAMGHATIVGTPQINNFDGECFILS